MNYSVLYSSNEKEARSQNMIGKRTSFHISGLMSCIYHDERIVRSIENFIIV